MGLGPDLEANTEFMHSASAVRPFEVREGMEVGTYTRNRLNEMPPGFGGGRFEISDMRFERCCFLALLRVDTHLFRALWKELRLP